MVRDLKRFLKGSDRGWHIDNSNTNIRVLSLKNRKPQLKDRGLTQAFGVIFNP